MGIRLGFIVNPIAGMGGRVGLKGTDGEAYRIALKKGAKPVSPERARVFLESLTLDDIALYVAPGPMGWDIVSKTRHRDKVVEVVGSITGSETSAEDTKRISREMLDKGIDLLVFVGGDGTARDVMDAIDQKIPVLGVPSGVKVYSGVFAVNPVAAAKIVEAFARGEATVVEEEVLDIDEEAFRRDELRIRLYGYMKTPVVRDLVQPGKQPSIDTADEEDNKKAIARAIVEEMEPDTLYILGPGTTVKAIADVLGVEKTVLGVDAVYNGKLVGKDLDEKSILKLLDEYPKAKIIVTPIGGQGFIFGRGNQQISPEVIKRIGGKKNIIVVATRRKLQNLKVLRVDTGDPVVDNMLRSYIRVVVDYNNIVMMKVV
ncbi:ATP-NAD kinase family protein [Desulfurococcaceae archaeon MEX13E-LK6-19]|nr:ATP-NAD kinase family protein [Desulfurococcaceae archaeon MEX13E-LK6-19]